MTEPITKTEKSAPSRWDSLVVVCAANSYDEIKLADQHMAEHLSMLTPVLYVDPPLSRLTQLRNPRIAASLKGPRLRMLTPRLARLTPVVQPGPGRPGLTPVTSALSRHYLRNSTSQLGVQVQAIVSAWPQYPVFGSCNEQARIYWAQDDFVGGAALLGLNAAQLDRRERRVAASADLVVAANPMVADTWRERGCDTTLIPYGADVDAYISIEQAPPPPDVHLEAPVAGFVGQLNDRTDLRLLEAIAESGRSLLLVGPVSPGWESSRFDALRQRQNVCWVGPKPFEVLPGYLRLIDVGLVPYRDSPFNRGSFPLKILEYLAAGRAVVATDLPAVRWLATDLVAVASEPRAFAKLVGHLLEEERTSAALTSRQAFAAAHSWARRAASLNELIVTASGRVAEGGSSYRVG